MGVIPNSRKKYLKNKLGPLLYSFGSFFSRCVFLIFFLIFESVPSIVLNIFPYITHSVSMDCNSYVCCSKAFIVPLTLRSQFSFGHLILNCSLTPFCQTMNRNNSALNCEMAFAFAKHYPAVALFLYTLRRNWLTGQ